MLDQLILASYWDGNLPSFQTSKQSETNWMYVFILIISNICKVVQSC